MRADVIVVGLDGSSGATDALRWAMARAVATGATLRVVTAWHMPVSGALVEPPLTVGTATMMEDAATAAIDKNLADVGTSSSEVDARVVLGSAASVLEEMGAQDDVAMVVVGRRGRGPLASVLLGSVSRTLVHHAPCPVAVVPEASTEPEGPVVVGLDGSPGSFAALAFARTLGGPIVAVRAWRVQYVFDVPAMPREEFEKTAQERLDADKAAFAALHGPVDDIEFRLVEGDARWVLPDMTASAIVVGTRHGVASRLLGSVTGATLVRSPVPVVVVPPTDEGSSS